MARTTLDPVCWDQGKRGAMSECKHGLRSGCAYCHARTPTGASGRPVIVKQAAQKRPTKATRLSEKMNDRMTALNRRLKELRSQ